MSIEDKISDAESLIDNLYDLMHEIKDENEEVKHRENKNLNSLVGVNFSWIDVNEYMYPEIEDQYSFWVSVKRDRITCVDIAVYENGELYTCRDMFNHEPIERLEGEVIAWAPIQRPRLPHRRD